MEPLRPDDPRELGGYRLLRRVGEGGMGVVYLATSADGAGADLAAVKAVRAEYAGDREFRARFTVEADLARRVRGPYTARVLDADTDGPRPWLATEYVPGPALQDAVRETGPFPEDSLLALASGLARALSAIHEVGLVHRDLKPSNVLLSSRGPQVIDFGIARAADATALTRTGQALGTPGYMSPEQATGSGLHGASDLFSFGGVLVFAATGRAPFGAGEPAALLYRVVNEEPDLDGLPDALFPLVSACLAKDPEERPGLDAVVAELSGTALPSADDETTEWLPGAIGATVHHTLVAATRVLPGGETGDEPGGQRGESEQDTEGGPATDAEDGGTARAEEGVPERAGDEGTGHSADEDEGTGAEPVSEARQTPEAATVVEDRSPSEEASDAPQDTPTNEHGAVSAEHVPDGQSSAERDAPEPEPSEEAASEASPSDDDAAPDEDNRDRASGHEEHPAEGPNPGHAPTAAAEASATDTGRDPRAPEPSESEAPRPGSRAPARVPDARRAAAWRAVLATPSPAPDRTPAADDEHDDRGPKALLFAGVLALALVIALALAPDAEEDTAADDSGVTGGGSSPSSSSAGSSDVEEEPDPAEVADIAPLSDDRFAVLSNHGVHVYDVDDPEPVEQLPETPENDEEPGDNPRIGGPPEGENGPDFTYSTLETSSDGNVVAAFSTTGAVQRIHVWDLESGDHHNVNPAGSGRFERDFALAPDGGTVFTSVKTEPDRETVVRAVDTESGDEVFTAEIPEYEDGIQAQVQAVEASPDGSALVVALSQGLSVWDPATGEPHPSSPQIREWPRSHNGPTAIGDGFVATAAYEQLLQWDIHSTGQPQESSVPYESQPDEDDDNPWITALSLSDDQERIVGTGHHLSEGLVLVWDRSGELLEEHRTDDYQYSASTAAPSGHGVIVADHTTGDEIGDPTGPHRLRLLDENLETSQEYELPAPDPDDEPSD
ncbi:protein kinase domain-containing protein [Nocardiopsis coralli]|uniref:protein kinase domain-containing protein n=1 Tax=Nocardiopsis coralli TaxID=2772213 RepID=UPI001F3B8954|nr:protein kinase [Nocardiopsis coralli]